MALKTFNPTTPGRRGLVLVDRSGLWKGKPERSLTEGLKNKGGRNNNGRITARRRGGGHKRRYRVIDFKRDKFGVPGQVVSIEYDPNRSSRIALVKYPDGDWRYILAPNGIGVGAIVESGENAAIRVGNALPLQAMPAGTVVHNVELRKGRGGQIVRSAGSSARVLALEGKYTLLRLPSGEVRNVLSTCMATVGQLSAVDHKNIKMGKAGRVRNLGRRPQVRGLVMSPRDHPHGGGEGRSSIGMPGPKTPWGKPALGYRTRNNKRTDKFIVRRRGQR